MSNQPGQEYPQVNSLLTVDGGTHGKVQQVLFPSRSTGTVRRAFVYTPPDYSLRAALQPR